jgi:hypothetical protein
VIAVLIFGSRNLPERRPVWTVLNGIAAWRADPAEPILVIEGGCPTGADLFAKEWAEGSPWPNIHHKQYPPDRRAYRQPPLLRAQRPHPTSPGGLDGQRSAGLVLAAYCPTVGRAHREILSLEPRGRCRRRTPLPGLPDP